MEALIICVLVWSSVSVIISCVIFRLIYLLRKIKKPKRRIKNEDKAKDMAMSPVLVYAVTFSICLVIGVVGAIILLIVFWECKKCCSNKKTKRKPRVESSVTEAMLNIYSPTPASPPDFTRELSQKVENEDLYNRRCASENASSEPFDYDYIKVTPPIACPQENQVYENVGTIVSSNQDILYVNCLTEDLNPVYENLGRNETMYANCPNEQLQDPQESDMYVKMDRFH